MSPISGHTYFIINKKANTAFDLSGSDQKSIIGWRFHGGNNQKWKITQQGDGWTFQNVYNGNYLDISDTPKDGARVIAIETSTPRRWDIKPDEKDIDGWRIFIQKSNQNVDLSDHGNATSGTPVTIWGRGSGKHQVWRFQEANKS